MMRRKLFTCPFICLDTFYMHYMQRLHCARVCASVHTRDKSSADDNVHLLTLFGKQLHLCLYELL